MKKLFVLFMTVFLCLSVVGCGDTAKGNDNSTQDQNTTTDIQDEVIQDERFAEGVNHEDIDLSKYIGEWVIYVSGSEEIEKQMEFFEDGRIILNGSTEYQWKNHDNSIFEVYFEGTQIGVGYFVEEYLQLETNEHNLIGRYSSANK